MLVQRMLVLEVYVAVVASIIRAVDLRVAVLLQGPLVDKMSVAITAVGVDP